MTEENPNPRPTTPVINEEMTRDSDATVPVEKLNNPETLGVTIRLKDIALVLGTTGLFVFILNSQQPPKP